MFPRPLLIFYTKSDCPLCDRVDKLLAIGQRRWRVEIKTVDIRSDPAVYELYRDRIPVVVFPDGALLEAPIRRDQLFRAIRICCS